MTLSEWISSAGSKTDGQIADIAAQLFAKAVMSGRKLSAAETEIVFPDGGEFGTLIFSEKTEHYENGVQPPPFDDGDLRAGNVYVCAMLLYEMLFGKLPQDYDALVQRAAIAASGAGSIPVLTAENSRFGKLIESATQISADKRITAEGALDMLAQARAGSAVVRIVERETGALIDRRSVSLEKGLTRWQPQEMYVSDGQRFFPEKGFELTIPYRVCPAEAVCEVSAAVYSETVEVSRAPVKGTVCLGFDLGACSSTVSLLDENGGLSEARSGGRISVPSLAAEAGGAYIFGSEAARSAESGAKAVRCLAGEAAENGCSPDAARGFMAFLRELAQTAVSSDKAVTAGVAFSGDLQTRALFEETARAAGWDFYFVDSAAAAGIYFREADPSALSENIMVFDAGESAVKAALFRADEELPIQTAQTPGGGFITSLAADRLFTGLLSRGIDLSENSVIAPSRLERGRKAVYSAAEEMKKRLSSDERVFADVTVPNEAQEVTERLTLERDQLEELLSQLFEKIKKAAAGALRADNMDESDITTVAAAGACFSMPAMRELIKKMFPKARIVWLRDVVSVSRGAAVYACIRRNGSSRRSAGLLTMDYGTQKVNAAGNRLVFERLLKAGEQFSVDGTLKIIYRLEAGKNDMDGGNIIFKLYTRPKGMEHVTSTLSPENAIKYAGRAEAPIPAGYDSEKDAVDFIININSGGEITASAEHLRKMTPFSRIKNRPVRDGMEILGELDARFVGTGAYGKK